MYYTNIFNDGFVEDFLDELFGGAADRGCACDTGRKPEQPKRTANVRTDIEETEKGYTFTVELPGFDKSEVKIELKDNYLTVKAEHAPKTEENAEGAAKKRYIRRERYNGVRQRSYFVGEDINAEGIKAGFNNGILTIDIPKKEPKEEAKVTISID
ncbi:MAG: Hsp20/alpha crystallin family protein [Eubacterium sp.]|nr:Hsp20/alpha crystallin family protein [Eubacterium sp.]HBE09678.1 hypothetical protein [Lachnospiraceae bacterium]